MEETVETATTRDPIPSGAQQGLASIRSLTLSMEQQEGTMASMRRERQRLLFEINRAGATYEIIAAKTGLRPSTVATEIAHYRDANGRASLPKGRRRGISPKSKRQPAAV
jgi:hypothetical protein